jgi:hypothetical protein
MVTGGINIVGMSSIRYQIYNAAGASKHYYCAFYRADDTLIGSVYDDGAASKYTWKTATHTVPAGSVYMRISGGTTNYLIVQGDSYAFQSTGEAKFPDEAGTVYGGFADWTNGKLTVTWGEIASYDGETLPGKWLSSMDVYVEGNTPTTGAQVVYELATPVEYDLTPITVTMFDGKTCITSITSAPYTRGVIAEYIVNDLLTGSDIDATLSVAGDAADAKAAGDAVKAVTGSSGANMTASENIASGAYFGCDGKLYVATEAIASGATITPGTNCTLTNLAAALNALAALIN